MTKINWTGFSKKSYDERLEFLSKHNLLSPDHQDTLEENVLLTIDTANQMVENVIGTFSLPFTIVPDVMVNDKVYKVPFVTEEPSVVAAATFASKIIKRSGGFKTKVHNRLMIGQVALYDVDDVNTASSAILHHKDEILELANAAHPSIVKRGGGARDLTVEIKEEFLILYLTVDTQEAMGANMVNTMLEAIKPRLEELADAPSLMAILSNYATESLVTAQCCIDTRFLSRNSQEAHHLAEKMVLASRLAQVDPYRAATHNKGIFNGIDALVLATGNDWRAIEAGSHAYASRQGQYHGLATWSYNENAKTLCGELTLPMPIATKGGSIGLNPTVQIAHDLLGNPSARELAQVIVAIGLAQNFAALKALTSTGIQSGHMKLQAKSLLLLAGAKESEIPQLLPQMLTTKRLDSQTAQELLAKFREDS
ncbi:hydroxymethylglutaryl-CoA reductase, degradative [Streptococcus caprae]|uniref:3-hydroxy-3-methylglutaryl coenzyme A reductase n=1 Tax=Streptococcus caprae TaxID=1640501 RepID=A0ABV8CUF6_9STRE